ncbi:enolase C-terminal domain-like protein [Allonocardiopsis opalescens]|uniref:L-alanine-DL-glutamate epimerase-like enolase superfamily enzyme n=1 Tax=Allonocardiopsis opalescens TaxID=1144618 RepID=A0A2T0Q7K6_9ACTN|nr:enolase C-terminal domain-like protein [Allonocardiopsis opalescens]PRX99703.1 L-alanine-DL-glutamate epimerase-like enolase superfamily enzyme [Allonocardiopsis opalescens]
MRIERVRIDRAKFEMKDFTKHPTGFSLVYEPGSRKPVSAYAVRVYTDEGVVGEYVGGNSVAAAQLNMFGDYLIGKDPFQRELLYNDIKRQLRKFDKMGMGLIDIPLWDLAGRAFNVPVRTLLGGWKTRLPAYASTAAGDRSGGLDSPEAYADFAVRCKEIGYRAYKLHVWDDYTVPEVVRTIAAVREAVGPDMDLMLDPGSKLETFAHAVQIGRACDEAGYLWLEDPYKDTGISIEGHRRLRRLIRTPLLQTEHVRGLEAHVDFIAGGGTDFVRADAEYDGGITGALKIAHAAEGFGLDVELHTPGPAQRQLMASIRNTNYYEMSFVHPKSTEIGRSRLVYADDYRDGLTAVDADGCVPVPEGPGLGVAYDWDAIGAHTVETREFG